MTATRPEPNGSNVAGLDPITQLREDFSRLRGQLFELFEAMGMSNRQLEAAKRLARRLTYDSQAELESLLRQHAPGGNTHDHSSAG